MTGNGVEMQIKNFILCNGKFPSIKMGNEKVFFKINCEYMSEIKQYLSETKKLLILT
jgi:hypothetical protein